MFKRRRPLSESQQLHAVTPGTDESVEKTSSFSQRHQLVDAL